MNKRYIFTALLAGLLTVSVLTGCGNEAAGTTQEAVTDSKQETTADAGQSTREDEPQNVLVDAEQETLMEKEKDRKSTRLNSSH